MLSQRSFTPTCYHLPHLRLAIPENSKSSIITQSDVRLTRHHVTFTRRVKIIIVTIAITTQVRTLQVSGQLHSKCWACTQASHVPFIFTMCTVGRDRHAR